jgi:hypothetical protein
MPRAGVVVRRSGRRIFRKRARRRMSACQEDASAHDRTGDRCSTRARAITGRSVSGQGRKYKRTVKNSPVIAALQLGASAGIRTF